MIEITQYRSDSGKSFDEPFDCLKDDLTFILVKHCENDAIVKKIVDGICADKDILAKLNCVINELHRFHPSQPKMEELLPPAYSETNPLIVVEPKIALAKCMGGKFCNHQPGTCTATTRHAKYPGEALTPKPYKGAA